MPTVQNEPALASRVARLDLLEAAQRNARIQLAQLGEAVVLAKGPDPSCFDCRIDFACTSHACRPSHARQLCKPRWIWMGQPLHAIACALGSSGTVGPHTCNDLSPSVSAACSRSPSRCTAKSGAAAQARPPRGTSAPWGGNACKRTPASAALCDGSSRARRHAGSSPSPDLLHAGGAVRRSSGPALAPPCMHS